MISTTIDNVFFSFCATSKRIKLFDNLQNYSSLIISIHFTGSRVFEATAFDSSRALDRCSGAAKRGHPNADRAAGASVLEHIRVVRRTHGG